MVTNWGCVLTPYNPTTTLVSVYSITVVWGIFSCKVLRLLIFRIVYFLAQKPSKKFSSVKYYCRKYFACLIFAAKAHLQKFLMAKISQTTVSLASSPNGERQKCAY